MLIVGILLIAHERAWADPALAQQLRDAAWRGENVMVRNLLDQGVDPNGEGPNGATPLIMAAARGHRTVASFLIRAGANPNKAGRNGCSPMTWAARNGWPEMIRFLHRHGAVVDHRDAGGLTPLMRAAWNARIDSVLALIELDADVTAEDNLGNTAIAFALGQSEAEIADALILAWQRRAGAPPDPDKIRYDRPPQTACAEPFVSR